MAVTGEMLIGRTSVFGSRGTFRATNPATGREIEPPFGRGGREEVERACALAWEAFHSYREVAYEQRAQFLEACASRILEIGDELIERATAETGLPPARIEGERARTVGQLRLFADVVRSGEWLDPPPQSPPPGRPARPPPRSPARPCGCATSPSGRSRCSGRATSRSRSRSPAATPPRRSPPAV